MSLLLVVLIFSIVALGYLFLTKPSTQNYYVGPAPPDKNTVSVSGEAKTTVAPDLGLIAFSIETNRSSAQESQADNAEIVQGIKQALLENGVKEKDLQTISFTVEPVYETRYECPEDLPDCDYYDRIYTQEIVGYKTTHQLRLSVEELDKTGKLSDAITEQGGNEAKINSISFDLRDETRNDLEKQLLQQASSNAKNKGQRVAEGLGVQLGKPLSVSESIVYPVYYDYQARSLYAAEAVSAAAPTEVFGGQIEVQVTVSATFEIE